MKTWTLREWLSIHPHNMYKCFHEPWMMVFQYLNSVWCASLRSTPNGHTQVRVVVCCLAWTENWPRHKSVHFDETLDLLYPSDKCERNGWTHRANLIGPLLPVISQLQTKNFSNINRFQLHLYVYLITSDRQKLTALLCSRPYAME